MMSNRTSSSPADEDPGNNHHDLNTRLDLLHDLLPPEEKKKALEHLAECPTCAELLRKRVAHCESVRSRGVPEIKEPALAGKAYAGQTEDDHLRGLWGRIREGMYWPAVRYASVLAVVLVALMLIVPQLLTDRGDNPQLEWLPPLGEELKLRDQTPALDKETLAAGYAAYAKHDLKLAAKLLAEVEVSGPHEAIRRAYLGSALAWNGKHEQAVSVLQAIEIKTLPEDYDEALWALYVSLRRLDRDSEADALLEDLVHRGHVVAERARAELELS